MTYKVSVHRKNEGSATPGTTTPQTMQQMRAHFSYKKVQEIAGSKESAKCFKSYANSFPAKVQMNGLGQALAFARSKSGSSAEGKAWEYLYQLVSDWLGRKEGGYFPGKDVLEGIMSSDMQVYRQAQAEVQALMVWVKQFARADIRGDD